MSDTPCIDTEGKHDATYKTYGERMSSALERIAAVMEATAAQNPLDAIRHMMDGSDGFPAEVPPDLSAFAPAMPAADVTAAAPDGWEQAGHALRVRLPDADYFLVFEDIDDGPPFFRLWLAGPGDEIRPLSWRDE